MMTFLDSLNKRLQGLNFQKEYSEIQPELDRIRAIVHRDHLSPHLTNGTSDRAPCDMLHPQQSGQCHPSASATAKFG